MRRGEQNNKKNGNGKYTIYKPNPIINEEKIRSTYQNSEDVKVVLHKIGSEDSDIETFFIYCESLVDKKQINQFIIPQLEKIAQKHQYRFLKEEIDKYQQDLEWTPLEVSEGFESISLEIFNGNLVLYFPKSFTFFSVSASNKPNRSTEQSNYETSIRGPRDNFIEDISTNVALIRKRLRHPTLSYQTLTLGKRTQTQIGILYLKDVVNLEILNNILECLTLIDIDGVVSSTQIQEMVSKQSLSIFPLCGDTARPDFAVECLLQGRVVIIIDGSPIVIIAPVTITFLIKAAEDSHFNFLTVSFARFYRWVGFLLAVFLPGFWMALLAYHQDQIPFPLLATVTVARSGLPFPAPLELIIVLFLFEMFREAGQRLPSPLGQTLSVVGGLIIGDAAIRSAFISPSVIVITALSAIAGYTLVNQLLAGAVSILRGFVLLCSILMGLYGFMLGGFVIVLYLSRLRSFGIPYLALVFPKSSSDFFKALFRLPWRSYGHRVSYLRTNDSSKTDEGEGKE